MTRLFEKLLRRGGIVSHKFTHSMQIVDFINNVRCTGIDTDLIRIGGHGDGGYLLPDDLEGIGTCFSPGVDVVATFEEDLARRGIKCFLADHSVEDAPIKNKNIVFEKRFLGCADDDIHMRLENWFSENWDETGDSLLQMDIEGAEYSVILDTPRSVLAKFRIMVIEFHDLEMLFSKGAFPFVQQVFDKLLQDFSVVHIHPNNNSKSVKIGDLDIPQVMEFTFYRKDRITPSSRALSFPHALDIKNNSKKADLILPDIWH